LNSEIRQASSGEYEKAIEMRSIAFLPMFVQCNGSIMSQENCSVPELIKFWLDRIEDVIPPKTDVLKMLDYLEIPESRCMRRSCWGEVILDRSRAMILIQIMSR
jgi:hypothetical protein